MGITQPTLATAHTSVQGAGFPKAELHLHLEGAISSETWRSILVRRSPRTAPSVDELRERVRFTGMTGFIDAWMSIVLSLREPEDYWLAARACGQALAEQGVWYAELHTSVAGAHWAGRLNADEVIPAIAEGLNEAQAAGGPQWRLIVDVIRELCREGAGSVGVEVAARHLADGVAAVGLGGEERRHPTGLAVDAFAAAAEAGLHRTAHAGEGAGPESIWAALEIGAERIGHATAAALDPALVAHLVDQGVPLEMCPTSNVLTGAVGSVEEHPIGSFLRRGLNVSLNTDDPALFGVSLSEEYVRVAEAFALTREEQMALARNAFRAAFLPEAEKAELLARFDAWAASATDGLR